MNNLILLLLPLAFSLSSPLTNYASKTFDGRAYNTSQKMDFTDSTTAEIEDYYGDIGTKKGDDLKDYLYDVLSVDNTFVTYASGVTQWYKITDRNWDLSREISPETYLFDDDKIVDGKPNFYETMLYFDDCSTENRQINTLLNSFTGVVGQTSVDWTNKTCPKLNSVSNNKVQVDKEHVWVKSHGFSPSGDPAKGAGTDLHHLLAADHNTNNVHNDKYYGKVFDHNSAQKVYCIYGDGTYDLSGWVGNTSLGEECFEPTDKWKGDIARALLYMGVRYSSQENNTESEPYLLLTDDNSLKDDNSSYHGVFHNLSSFIEWNDLDPVDEYEIHRNNLIYKNVQNNRNPFIDHPEWVKRVYAPNLINDFDFSNLEENYNLHIGKNQVLDITLPSDSALVSAITYDNTVISLFEDKKTITPIKEGSTTLSFTVLDHDYNPSTFETEINVKPELSFTTALEGSSLFLRKDETFNLNPVLSNAFDSEIFTIEADNLHIISVSSSGVVTALDEGMATISITLNDSESTILSTIDVLICNSQHNSDLNLHVNSIYPSSLILPHSDETITMEYDETAFTVNSDYSFVCKKEGSYTIKFTVTYSNDFQSEYTYQVTCKKAPTVSYNNIGLTIIIKKNEVFSLNAKAENTFEDETLVYESVSPEILSVDAQGNVTGLKKGLGKVNIYLEGDSKVLLATVEINVEEDNTLLYIIIIVVASVLLIAFFAIIFLATKTKSKKSKSSKSKAYSKAYNKKGSKKTSKRR
ncbi:MAG: endonuclease [Bacilli bacterium]